MPRTRSAQSLSHHRQQTQRGRRWLQPFVRAWGAFCDARQAPPAPWVEEYEPRLLYSADFAPDALALAGSVQVVEQRLLDSSGELVAAAAENVAQRVELLIVYSGVTPSPELIDGLSGEDGRRIEVLVLDSAADAIGQISAALSGRSDISALHILSHGASGELRLGSTILDASELSARSADIAAWGEALNQSADILIYGCDVAVDARGEAFVQQLSKLTRADVAASTNATGNVELGGDWNLEFTTGSIESRLVFTPNASETWSGLLANPVLSGANNLAAIDEDDVTNSGTLVSALIAGQVTDPDAGALSGIAVTAVDNTNGTWQYSTDGGGVWNAFGAPSVTNARLLAADADNLVRFVPNANFNGTVAGGLTFRAWDQTSGSDGGTANINTTTATVRD